MNTDDVTLIATGPLTNIACAIHREPRIVERVKELSIMGGSVPFGNWTPTAEFNIFVDPEAAYKVFHSGIHVKMSGLNLTRQCCLTAEHVAEFRKIGTKAANLAADLTELKGELTRGMTVCDYRHLRGVDPAIDLYREPQMDFRGEKPNAEAALELDFPGFMELLYTTLRNYN